MPVRFERLESGASLRVTQLVLSNAYAGTEAHVALLSESIALRGTIVRLVCGDQNQELIERSLSAGVSVQALRLGRGNLPVDWPAAYRATAGWGSQIVHAHLGSSLLAGALLTTTSRRRLVFTQHFIKPAYRNKSGLGAVSGHAAHRFVHRRVARVIASTHGVREELANEEGFPVDRIAVIPLGLDVEQINAKVRGIDIRAELGIPDDAVLAITPARLEREKDHMTLLAAFAEVVQKHPTSHLLLAGSGSRERMLRERVQRVGVESRVHFLGHRSDVPSLLSQASVCILPSFEESFGLVLLEAMAVGTPVVACYINGPRDIVVDGETGLLVPPQDPTALAAAIQRLLDYPHLAAAMGQAGRVRVSKTYSAHQMAEQTLEVYATVLAPGALVTRLGEGRTFEA